MPSYRAGRRAFGYKLRGAVRGRRRGISRVNAPRFTFMSGRRSLRRPELKWVDVLNSSVTIAGLSSTSLSIINIINTGSSTFNRIGNKVNMRSLEYHIQIYPLGTTSVNMTDLRFLVVYDRQTNGAAPTFADVIQNLDLGGGTSSNSWDFPNGNNKDRFLILKDQRKESVSLTWNTNVFVAQYFAGAGEYDMAFHGKINLTGLETVYSASTGAVGDIRTGGLFYIILGQNNTDWKYSAHMRLTYQDP